MYTVKQAAAVVGISEHTLRFYAREGLFPLLERDDNNVRKFSDGDIEWAGMIKCLRETGMPLAEVKRFIQLCSQGDDTIPQRYEMLILQKAAAELELERMRGQLAKLDAKADYYRSLMEGNGAAKCYDLN